MEEHQKQRKAVLQGFSRLHMTLAPFVARALRSEFRELWWQEAVLKKLSAPLAGSLPEGGAWEELAGSLDIHKCLLLMDLHWHDAFAHRMPPNGHLWVRKLLSVRSRAAHMGREDFSLRDRWRAIDTMVRLCEPIDLKQTKAIDALMRDPTRQAREENLETLFRLWAKNAPGSKGSLYAPATIESYCNELKYSARALVWSDPTIRLRHTNLFECSTYPEYAEAIQLILRAQNYAAVNDTNYGPTQKEHGTLRPKSLSSAMRLCERFLLETKR